MRTTVSSKAWLTSAAVAAPRPPRRTALSRFCGFIAMLLSAPQHAACTSAEAEWEIIAEMNTSMAPALAATTLLLAGAMSDRRSTAATAWTWALLWCARMMSTAVSIAPASVAVILWSGSVQTDLSTCSPALMTPTCAAWSDIPRSAISIAAALAIFAFAPSLNARPARHESAATWTPLTELWEESAFTAVSTAPSWMARSFRSLPSSLFAAR